MRLAVFDVGGTAIKHALMEDGTILSQGEVPTPGGESEDIEPFLAALEELVDAMAPVDGVAFSLPGVIDVDSRYLFAGGALKYNYGVDASAWEERFGVPVEVENDARCSTMAELAAGNLKGVMNGAVLTFGTGIGGGIVVGGQVYKGSHRSAGEASQVYFTQPRIDSAVREEGSFATMCSTHGLCRRVAEAKGIDACTGREVFAWIEEGDEVAAGVFRDVCDGIVLQIHNLQCWLDPERICLGGGVSKNPLFIQGVRDAYERLYTQLAYELPRCEIMPCKFFNDANLMGAYAHFVHMREKRAAAAA